MHLKILCARLSFIFDPKNPLKTISEGNNIAWDQIYLIFNHMDFLG